MTLKELSLFYKIYNYLNLILQIYDIEILDLKTLSKIDIKLKD